MSKRTYSIYNKFTRKNIKVGSYDECLKYFNEQDKTFRLQHKIVKSE